MENLTLIKPEKVQNIINKFCYTIGMIPTSYKMSLTYEEQIIAIGHYLEETVIPALNNNAEAVAELQSLFIQLKDYVENYFNNLDVQNEINNKLDSMLQSGELADIIAQYLELAGILAYNNIADLKQAQNIVDGSFVRTYSQDNINDGKGAFYKVRQSQNTDIIDDINIVALADTKLVAEKMKDFEIETLKEEVNKLKTNFINVKNYGAVGDGVKDDTLAIQNAIDDITDNSVLYFPKGTYKITAQNQYHIDGYGDIDAYYGLFFNNKNNFKIICDGIILPDYTSHIMNIFAFQYCNNVEIYNIKSSYTGNIFSSALQSKCLSHFNRCDNIKVFNAHAINVGSCVMFTVCTNSIAKDCIGERTSLNYTCPSFFGNYLSSNCNFETCSCFGATNDGDIGFFGGCEKSYATNCKLYNSFRNSMSTPAFNIAQGIFIDSNCKNININNNIVFAYYYGIDVKTSCSAVNVVNNQCVNCKVGIAVRLGENQQRTFNTLIANNIITPNSGMGETTTILEDFILCGILVENAQGVQINNNMFTHNPSENIKTRFVGILARYTENIEQIYINPLSIDGNEFNFENAIGANVSNSNSIAIYVIGNENQHYKYVNIVNNMFKMPWISDTQFDVVYVSYCRFFNINNNNFSERNASTSNICVNNCLDGNIANNSCAGTRKNLVISNSSFININNNMLLNSGENQYTIELTNCNHLVFNGNYYKSQNLSNEAVICIVANSNKIYAVANTCYSVNNTFLVSAPWSPSTDLVNSETNLYWNS